MEINKFNIRVYGILVYKGKVLIAKENIRGFEMTKFPGGGLEFGEGLKQGLRREFIEETGLQIQKLKHFYTTGYFQESAFKKNEQIISVYYLVKNGGFSVLKIPLEKQQLSESHSLTLFWEDLKNLKSDHFTFPIDQKVVKKILLKF